MNHFPASVMQNGTADEERQQETEESFWLPPKMKMCESECVRVTVCQRQIQRHKHTHAHTTLARSMTDFISLLIKSYPASHYDTRSSASADGSARLFSPSLSVSPVFFYPFLSLISQSYGDMQCSHNFRKSSWSDVGKVEEDALNDFEWRNVV